MIDLKKAMTRITELEEELKSTHDGYEEEMTILVEMNDDLTRKLGVFMGDPVPGGAFICSLLYCVLLLAYSMC